MSLDSHSFNPQIDSGNEHKFRLKFGLKHNKLGYIHLSVPFPFPCRHTHIARWQPQSALNYKIQRAKRWAEGASMLVASASQPWLQSSLLKRTSTSKWNWICKNIIHSHCHGSSAGITLWVYHIFEFWSSCLQLRDKCFWSLAERSKIKGMKFCITVYFPLKENTISLQHGSGTIGSIVSSDLGISSQKEPVELVWLSD